MKYKVIFSQQIVQDETNEVLIEASNKEEAINKVKDMEYDSVEILNATVSDVKNFNIIKVEECY
jgi:hypothetical protein